MTIEFIGDEVVAHLSENTSSTPSIQLSIERTYFALQVDQAEI